MEVCIYPVAVFECITSSFMIMGAPRLNEKCDCKISFNPMSELFTFKLLNLRNNVNDLRENYWLIFRNSFIYH